MVVTIDKTTVALWEHQGRSIDYGYWDRDDIEEMVARANRGATLLDEKRPGWHTLVTPARLDMSSGLFCIVGQVYGDYDQSVGTVFGVEYTQTDEEAVAHGFLTQDEDDDMPWSLMDRVWVYLLEARAESGAPVTLELPEREPFNIAQQRLIDADLIAA